MIVAQQRTLCFTLLMLMCFLFYNQILLGQQSNLTPNIKANWVAPAFSGIASPATSQSGHTGTAWTNAANVTDANLSNSATLKLVSRRTGLLNGCAPTDASGSITIGNAAYLYNVGNYVAFIISNPNSFSSIKVETSRSGSGGFAEVALAELKNLGSGRYEYGGYAKDSFSFVRLSLTLNAPPAVVGCGTTPEQTLTIYNALQETYAAPTGVTCNISNALTTATHELTVDPNNVLNNASAIIDADLTNYYSFLLSGSATVRNAHDIYPVGSYLGFKVSAGLLGGLLNLNGVLGNTTITTYLNGVQQEQNTGQGLLVGLTLLGGNNPYEVGFISTKPANEVRITYSGTGLNVYNLVYKCYTEGPAFACNTKVRLTTPAYPVSVNKSIPGLLAVGIGSSGVSGLDNIVDDDLTNYASFGTNISLTADVEIGVKKALSPIPAGHFAGIDLEKVGLLDATVLGNIRVTTYKAGVFQESSQTGGMVSIGTSLLNGNGRQIVGFKTSLEFDEIRLVINQTIGASLLSELRIYGAVVQRFCSGVPLACGTATSNVLTTMTTPDYPLYIDGKFTSTSGLVAVSGSINTSENVIDNNLTNFASLDMTAGVAATTTFAITDALDNYSAGTYVSFDIASNRLADVNVLNAIKVRLIKDGVLLSTTYTPTLLAGVGALAGEQRQRIGIVAQEEFDGAQLVIEGITNVGLLGTLKIYGVAFQKLCSVPLSCNQFTMLRNGMHPVIINDKNTGASGLVNASLLTSTVQNAWNAIDAYDTTYATLTKSVGVASSVSLSVLNPVDDYPMGTFAGFRIVNENIGLLQLDLFNSIEIRTYINGNLQETMSGSRLLNLGLLGLPILGGGSGTAYNVGFYTTMPFDEIKISLNDLVGANANLTNPIRVYGAFVDTRFAIGGGLLCSNTNPDFAVTQINQEVRGNANTNDNVPSGTTYGTPVANGSNPTTDIPVMNSNGSYTFTPTTAGVYAFDVPVCSAGQTSGCATERLTITVLNPNSNTNKPVVNDDVATTVGAPNNPNPVTIPVKANDGAGNAGGVLGTPTVPASGTGAPAHGTVSVDGNGNLVYTPDAGFYGTDEFTYTLCEMPANTCGTATVRVSVLTADVPNSTLAADDYMSTLKNMALTVSAANGVLANDTDPEGNQQSVTPKTETAIGKGTLVLAADGSYTFTPVIGFTGPVQFTYDISDNGAPVATAKGTLHILVKEGPLNTLPDFAVTQINQEVGGNVNTNDKVPAGTTYGIPVANGSNPTTDIPVMNSSGSYTFTPTAAGVYAFDVPVCSPGQTSGCATERLTITALNPNSNTNKPVVNDDVATTVGAASSPSPVTIPVKANDGPGNVGGVLGTPTVPASGTGAPAHGTVSVDGNGNLVYTPDAGFYGTDEFTYTLCETPANTCGTATVRINVLLADIPNSTLAADDYISTPKNMAMTVSAANGVLANDTDPESNQQSVTPKTETITGKGALVLAADGSYTFTPVIGFTGPVQFTYDISDNGSPVATAKGTLHILVKEGPLNTLPDFAVTNLNQQINSNVSTNDNLPTGTTYGVPVAAGTTNPTSDVPSMSANGSYIFTPTAAGLYVFNVPVCLAGQSSGCATERLTITVVDPTVSTNNPVVNDDVASTIGAVSNPTPVTIAVKANDGPGNSSGIIGTPVLPSSGAGTPAHGTVSVDGNGNVVYTPDAGFYGTDEFTYTLCETPGNTCGTATVRVYVLPPDASNSTLAADDYKATPQGSALTVGASEGLLANDKDPEGDAQTVIAKTEVAPGKGTLVLAADGSYTFTPVAGYTGPVEFVYEVQDNANPAAMAKGTLHILVRKVPDLSPLIRLGNPNFVQGQSKNFVVTVSEINNIITTSQMYIQVSVPPGYELEAYDTTLTTVSVPGIGVLSVSNNDWEEVTSGANTIKNFRSKPGVSLKGSASAIGLSVKNVNSVPGSTANMSIFIYQDPTKTYDSNTSNNTYLRFLTSN